MRRHRRKPKFHTICERSGFKIRLKDAAREPGTGYIVHKKESDGRYNVVTHPRNYPPVIRGAEGLPKPLQRPAPAGEFLHTFRYLGLAVGGKLVRISLNKQYYIRIPWPDGT